MTKPSQVFAVCQSCEPPRRIPVEGIVAHMTEHHFELAAVAAASLEEGRPPGQTAMDEWVALFSSRDDLVPEYARLIEARHWSWGGWPVLNLAIIDRWSESGLAYIKREAWKRVAA